MKKLNLFVVVLLLLYVLPIFPQMKETAYCATDAIHFESMKNNPDYKRKFDQNNADWEKYNQLLAKRANKSVPLTGTEVLNVAFHDLTSSNSTTALLPGITTIADYQYIINGLNSVFNGVNLFSSAPGNPSSIQFCLARKIMSGDDYHVSLSRMTNVTEASSMPRSLSAMNAISSASMSSTYTPASSNINVYIVDSIVGVAGFATLPSSHGSGIDGIYISRAMFQNDSNFNQNMEVLVHEMGHYLGLFHTFGICDPDAIAGLDEVVGGITTNPCSCNNNNCLFNGDMVCDTPPNMMGVQPYTYTCTTFPNTCNTDVTPGGQTSDVADDKANYMDYGIANCHSHFTPGQITRMQFMIDPEFGPRKSLIGQAACVNCTAMNGCTLVISPGSLSFTPRNEIVQTALNTTPAVTFNAGTAFCSSPTTAAAITYSWTLRNLDNGSIVFSNAPGSSYTTTAGLVPANYALTATATYTNVDSTTCQESLTHNFVIYPFFDGTCTLVAPADNMNASWLAEGWDRTSFNEGWAMTSFFPISYVNNQSPHAAGTTGFDSSGFDVVNLVGGALPSGYDPNFSGIALPPGTNVNRVMRIGQLIETTEGNAYYAAKSITVSKENCRFRVWYLGGTEGDPVYIKYPFHVASDNTHAAFGILNKYAYNSPVNTVSTAHNSEMGLDRTGNFPGLRLFSNNDMVSMKLPTPPSGLYDSSASFRKMTQWTYQDLDYSDFVALSPDTQVTITLFAHANTNSAGQSIQRAYGYFGLECLGGSMPRDFTFDIPDQVMPCILANQSVPLVIDLDQIKPAYLDSYAFLASNNSSANLVNIKIYKAISPGVFNTNPEPGLNINTGKYVLSLNSTDAPFAHYKIVYKTLYKEVTDEFRVFTGFYINPATCPNGGQIDTAYYSGINGDPNPANDVNIVNNDLLLCGTSNLPLLNLSPTCVTVPSTYQWYVSGILIPGATGEDLQLAYNPGPGLGVNNNYYLGICLSYVRKTLYKEPYCGNTAVLDSQVIKVYNTENIIFTINNTNDSDICFGNPYHLEVGAGLFNPQSCIVPTALWPNPNASNTFNFQMYDPISQQPIGNIVTFTNNGPISSITLPTMVFDFDNTDPSNPSQSLFVPTTSNNIFSVYLRVTGTYMGCPISYIHGGPGYPVQTITFKPSALGGTISYNCLTPGITNTDPGMTNGGYGWEISSTGTGGWSSIPGAPNTATLSGSFISTLVPPGGTVYIRRKSLGFTYCPDDDYSNTVIITNGPSTITFTLPGTICNGATAPLLPTTSSNGVAGSWNPAVVSNSVSATYTFTPLPGYCLPKYNYTLTVTNLAVPTFAQIAPICSGQPLVLPTTSTNSITGTWSPTADNTTTTNYTFTPTGGSCPGTPVTMTVVVTNNLTPSFASYNLDTSFCTGSTAPLLPNTDDNGITGTWSPALVSNTATAVYTFTPGAGQCANPFALTITVVPVPCGLTLSWSGDVSCQEGVPGVKIDADIEDGACIRVCENSKVTYTLNGNFGPIDHTDWIITGGTPDPALTNNTQCGITWDTGASGVIQATVYFTDGSNITISKCIEKLNKPNALFGAMPNVNLETVSACKYGTIYFENLSTANGGNETLYYLWNFGDGTTSSEFEPSHVYTQSGTYTVDLLVYNGCSCKDKYSLTVVVSGGNIEIECPGVVCEGTIAEYSVADEVAEGCTLTWNVQGGTIIDSNPLNTHITVVWNHVDDDGFGYVNLNSSCTQCPTLIKIPVVKNTGTIKGSATLCQGTQGVYSLPQWPSTDYNWAVDNYGTGATIILNNNRNEIIVQGAQPGTIKLRCNYFNTLLSCAGTAEFDIDVLPQTVLAGPTKVCTATNLFYSFTDTANNPITGVDWLISGPNGFNMNGSWSPIEMAFPNIGTYTIEVTSAGYCSSISTINVIPRPSGPTAITGPTTVCAAVTYNYSCAPVAGMTTHWEVINGTILGSSVGNQISVIFNTGGPTPYKVRAWYENDNCPSEVFELPVQRDVPNLNFLTAADEVCGSTFENYAIANVQADSYNWTIDPESAGSVQSGQNTNAVSILWNQQPGMATIKLEVQKCGAVYQQTYDVEVINSPVATITAPASTCVNKPNHFEFTLAPAGNFVSALWDFGNGDTLTVPYTGPGSFSCDYSYTGLLTGSVSYPVTLTVYGAGGCVMPSVANFTITVSPSPEIYVSPVGNLNKCDNILPSGYTFTVNMQGGFAMTDTIEWFYSASGAPNTFSTTSITTATINFTNMNEGFYYAEVSNIYMCTTRTRVIRVYSHCICMAPYIVAAQIDTQGCNSIKLVSTLIQGNPLSVGWQYSTLPGGTIIQDNTTYFEATGIEPGEYEVKFLASYQIGGTICAAIDTVPFTIPYKAKLKYQAVCNSGSYNLVLLDHSVFFPGTPIEEYSFTIDGGTNWYSGTAVSGINQFTINGLAPGNYTIGIRIKRNNYDACEYFENIYLPGIPSSDFSYTSPTCMDSAVVFNALANDSTLSYEWDFAGAATNLQQDPVRVFDGSGSFLVTLTATNKYGCSSTTSKFVPVLDVDMKGKLEKSPISTCAGSPITLHYNPLGTTIPQTVSWFHNNTNSTPVATTTGSVHDLAVTQPGLYFAHVTAANGCTVKTIASINVSFVPLPQAPVITGTSTVCQNGRIDLSVTANPSVTYMWYRNNTLMPLWTGASSIFEFLGGTGTVAYKVIARVGNGNGGYCYSPAGLFTVTIVPPPTQLTLDFVINSCDPYEAAVFVTNVEPGVNYYWSNGAIGTSTIITHDGPIQVRAERGGCSSTAQRDLPRDLVAASWVFPKGCYVSCEREALGYVIGPLGGFTEWNWFENGVSVQNGTGLVLPYNGVLPTNQYELYLSNNYCDIMIGDLDMSKARCEKCGIEMSVSKMRCVKVIDHYVYEMTITLTNPFADTHYGILSMPNGEGYFLPSSVTLPPYSTTSFVVQMYQMNGFNGGNAVIRFEMPYKGSICYTTVLGEFESCKNDKVNEDGVLAAQFTNDLVVAPNPSSSFTTVYYSYETEARSASRSIEIFDMLGRKLLTLPVSEQFGHHNVDTIDFAAGQYLVIMKENDKAVKNVKLLIKH